MYKDIETETSYRYLKTVIAQLKEPLCILGGWAVFFTVNTEFERAMKRTYLGSRDIDLGFRNATSFKQSVEILEKELQFKAVSFRYVKAIHAETGKDLTEEESRSLPQHLVFHMYVDPIFPSTTPELKKQLGFAPIDEPLLKKVFEEKKYMEVKEFGRKLLLPTPEFLLATKLNAVADRDKTHKRIKDICDITALCLFSGVPFVDIITKARRLASPKRLDAFRKLDVKEDLATCAQSLGLEPQTVKGVIDGLRE